jgi:hypothetical protein
MPDLGDVLLFALSAWRQMTWQGFRDAFDQLYERYARSGRGLPSEPDRHERRRAVLALDALAHCDAIFAGDADDVFVAPPVLAALPTAGLPRAVLCGSRSPEAFRSLQAAATASSHRVRIRVTSQSTAVPFAPSRVEVEADSDSAMHEFATQVGVVYESIPVSWSLAGISGSVDEYLAALEWSHRPDLSWPRSDFNPEALHFAAPRGDSSPLLLSRYQDPVRGQFRYWLWKGDLSAPADPAWGRYAVLQLHRNDVLRYEPESGTLSVPSTVPLPRLLSRALTLCSGYAARAMSQPADRQAPRILRYDVYRSVPPDVNRVCAEKLGQLNSFAGE